MSSQIIQSIGSSRTDPKQALVLGSTGMVGRSWCALLEREGIEFRAVSRPEFDLLNPQAVRDAIELDDDLVINAAAWTDVDGAESDPDGANQANSESVGILADRCHALGATIIHYSTDYVFDGQACTPYPVDAPINPSNAYGRSKALGEKQIRQTHSDAHIIIRTSWVYAPWGNNFVRTIAKLAAEKSELRVVDDQRGRPSSAEQLAATSLELYRKGAIGTWHASDAGECTWCDLAKLIAARVNPDCVVNPCSSDEYPRSAFRPPYSVLDIGSTESVCGPLLRWEDAVSVVLDQIINGK